MASQGNPGLKYVYADGSQTRQPISDIPYVFSYQPLNEPGREKQLAVHFPKDAKQYEIIRAAEKSNLPEHVKSVIAESVSGGSLEEILIPVGNGNQNKGNNRK
jgi:hypothetical protein